MARVPNKAAPALDDKGVLEAALAALRQHGVDAQVQKAAPAIGRTRANAVVRLELGGKTVLYAAEVKRWLTPGTLGHAVAQIRDLGAATLLVTDYVTPPVAEKLKEMDVPFIDAAGNAYIRRPPTLIWVTGRKPMTKLRPARAGRAFQPGGLKLLFAFLCRPELVGAPYREIVAYAGLAQGTVGLVMGELLEAGFVMDLGQHGRRLRNGRKLLDQWTEAYARTLRPRLLLGRYRAPERNWWETVDAQKYGALLGGEPAAARLTQYLGPGVATFYAEQVPARLLADFRLRTDPNGDVEFRQRFWPFDYPWDHPDMVPPALIYADLLATGDARCIETAKRLYDTHLDGLLGRT